MRKPQTGELWLYGKTGYWIVGPINGDYLNIWTDGTTPSYLPIFSDSDKFVTDIFKDELVPILKDKKW